MKFTPDIHFYVLIAEQQLSNSSLLWFQQRAAQFKPRSVETFSARSCFYTNCRTRIQRPYKMAFKRHRTTLWGIDFFLCFSSFSVLTQHYWFALRHSIGNARRLKRSGALALSHWDWVTEDRNDEGIIQVKKREKENTGCREKRENTKRRWRSELKATCINSDLLQCVEWTWVQWQFDFGGKRAFFVIPVGRRNTIFQYRLQATVPF